MEQEGSPELQSHERHYTVEQANAALPWVGERLERIRGSPNRLPPSNGWRAPTVVAIRGAPPPLRC